MTLSEIVNALATKRGVVLIAPALLLVGTAFVIGHGKYAAPAADATSGKAVATATAFTGAQRKDIEAVIKDYLLNNPEIMLEVQAALEAKMEKVQAEKTAAALKSHAAEIFRPAFSPVVGDAKGDVTIVEFFDYNCGYCRKALGDVAQ